jgi:hypothetical protein
MGVDNSAFDRQFAAFAAAARSHMLAEESQEFPLLRASILVERRQSMANQVRAAQSEPW